MIDIYIIKNHEDTMYFVGRGRRHIGSWSKDELDAHIFQNISAARASVTSQYLKNPQGGIPKLFKAISIDFVPIDADRKVNEKAIKIQKDNIESQEKFLEIHPDNQWMRESMYRSKNKMEFLKTVERHK